MPDDPRFQRLFFRYYERVYFLFRGKRFSVEDAKDLTQVVFLRVHLGKANYRGDAEWSYLKTIAERVGYNEMRYRRTQARSAPTVPLDGPDFQPGDSEDGPLSDSTPTAEELLLAEERSRLDAERSRRLRAAIEELPPRTRRIMKMRVGGGLKYREIAESLDVTIDTVKRLIHEGKKKLGQKLGD